MPRLLSALVMVAIGGFSIWAGGFFFSLTIALCCGVMVWELSQMLAPRRFGTAVQLGALTVLVVFASGGVPMLLGLALLILPAALGWILLGEDADIRFSVFSLWIALAGFSFIWLRNDLGAVWLIWLVVVVVATDVAGYFAGKTFGGPKFWPRISPKKTWSGTSAGWLAAAVVGAGFAPVFGMGFGMGAGFVLASVLVAMASQAGDVAESALKRQTGVKDSSALIPGHGGLLDRFDGMLGAAAMFLLLFTFLG